MAAPGRTAVLACVRECSPSRGDGPRGAGGDKCLEASIRPRPIGRGDTSTDSESEISLISLQFARAQSDAVTGPGIINRHRRMQASIRPRPTGRGDGAIATVIVMNLLRFDSAAEWRRPVRAGRAAPPGVAVAFLNGWN